MYKVELSQRVLAFAYSGGINGYVSEVLRLQKDFLFPTANTAITIVRVSDKQRVLSVLNDIGQ
jgi:probable phosphoglycerate mutase